MEKNKLRVRITFDDDSKQGLNSREGFWKYVSSRAKKNDDIATNLEYIFKWKFPKELKEDLQQKFQSELRHFEQNYEIDLKHPYLDELFHFGFREKSERFYFNDFINGISRLQELKNEYFKENKEYQELLNKNLIATQIDFGIGNISYSSLGFDLSVEPIEKAIHLFDNNFEYFCLFLNAYIPQSFLSSLSIYNDDLPISVSIDYPNGFQSKFNKKESEHILSATSKNNSSQVTKWDKAKWAWALANGSLLIPIILALLILYIAFSKVEQLNEVHKKNYEMIQLENDKLIQNYQKLLEIQKNVYTDIMDKSKTSKK